MAVTPGNPAVTDTSKRGGIERLAVPAPAEGSEFSPPTLGGGVNRLPGNDETHLTEIEKAEADAQLEEERVEGEPQPDPVGTVTAPEFDEAVAQSLQIESVSVPGKVPTPVVKH